MISVTLQRDKCIGCNYCYEIAPELFRMSKKDGKSVLLNSTDKRGFYTIRTTDDMRDQAMKTKDVCPVSIIKVHDCKRK
ncbi:MAG: ferredoxin [Flavobacteriales bacterium]|nr:ferredoxin [Flavobacteriales bacterium]